MKTSPIKILLLETSVKKNSSVKQILDENGFQTESFCAIEQTIEKITNQSVDLIICDCMVNEYNGFAVFKMLKKYLRNYGVPFFLILDKYEKEDILIGLEMGIDNFLVSPFSKESVYYKIENQLNKKEELNIFETGSFKEYFNSSLIAMFYVEDDKITLVNKAFSKINYDCANEILQLPVQSVFTLTALKQNELNYRRFQNGITNYCLLTYVNCFKNSGRNFDVSFYRGKNQGATHVFAEIVEYQNGKENSQANSKNSSNNEYDASIFTEEIKLTAREHQVFEMSANGLPIKIIASELNLSERTVEKHRANIMAKAKAKNMIEAIIQIHKSQHKTEYNETKF